MMYRKFGWDESHNSNRRPLSGVGTIATLLACCALLTAAAFGQTQSQTSVPSAIFTRLSYISAVNGIIGRTGGQYNYQGSAGHLAGNSRGDLFFIDDPYQNSLDDAYLVEVPAAGGSQIIVATGLGWGTNPVGVDLQDNLYIANSSGNLVYIPIVNGTYGSGTVASALTGNCTFPLNTNTAPCEINFGQPLFNYYVHANDIAIDGQGNIYVIDVYDGDSNGHANRIVQITSNGTESVLVDSLPSNQGAQMSVDLAGDVFYCNTSTVVEYTAASGYTNTAIPIGTGLVNADGVTVDKSNNVYITDQGNDRIVVVPYLNGAFDSAAQYTLNDKHAVVGYNGGSQNGYAQDGIGVDGYGNVYYTGNYGNSINLVALNNIPFGGTGIATPTAATYVNLYFPAATTLGSLAVVANAPGSSNPFSIASTTCLTNHAYTANATCSIQVIYTATAVGLQTGALRAYDTSNNLLGEALLSGTGLAAGLNVDPGTVTPLASGWTAPSALTLDGAANLYVADSSTGNIYKLAAGANAATVATSGFNSPTAVVADGAGNLYVGDSGNGRIAYVPVTGGTYGAATTVLTGLSGPSGLAIDGVGNVYVADSGNARVLRLGSVAGQPAGTEVDTLGHGFVTPVALALDTANNLYVSDTGLGEVVQLAIPTSQQNVILSGLATPAGVAVDSAGTLYAADSGAQNLYRVPSISGVIDTNFQTILSPVTTVPNALALDNAGNLYVADTANANVAESERSIGLLNFGRVNVGATSSIISASVSSGGTQALALSTPYFNASGDTSSFTMETSSAACTDGETLNPGANCTLAAEFNPATPGQETENLVFASTSANSSGQSLALTGDGVQLIDTSLAITVTSPTGSISYGQPVTVQATLTPSNTSAGTPGGTVTFAVDTQQQPPVTLTGDTASITLTGLTGGPHTITASYSGDLNYASSASNSLGISISTETTITTLSLTPSSSLFLFPTSAAPGTSLSFVATVTPTGAGAPTGSVTLMDGNTALGTASVAPLVQNGQPTLYQANFSLSNIPSGNNSIVAVYSGDPNFTTSTSSNPIALLIAAPSITMTANTTNITAGQTSITLTLDSVAGFASTAQINCLGLPAYATCSLTPAFAEINANLSYPVPTQNLTTVVLQVVPNQAPPEKPGTSGLSMPDWPRHRRLAAGFAVCLLFPAALLGFRMRRSQMTTAQQITAARRMMLAIALLLSLGSLAGLSGCGSSQKSFITPNGNYTFTVNATVTIDGSGGTPILNPPPAQTLTLNLTVN